MSIFYEDFAKQLYVIIADEFTVDRRPLTIHKNTVRSSIFQKHAEVKRTLPNKVLRLLKARIKGLYSLYFVHSLTIS